MMISLIKSRNSQHKNYNLEIETDNKQKEIGELEKKLSNNSNRSFSNKAKLTNELDYMIQIEKKKAQEALEFVRDALKEKIQSLEVKLQSLDANESRKEKRRIERDQKQVTRKIEEGSEQSASNVRNIESLEKQLAAMKARAEKLTFENAQLDRDTQKLEQTVLNLENRLDLANDSNARFGAKVPLELTTAIEEEAKKRK